VTTTKYHESEIYFCGFSGSGKSTLISKLISEMSLDYNIGYLKHDAHKFSMDKEGKDTWKASKAGAKRIAITSKDKNAYIVHDQFKDNLLRPNFSDCDMLFVEGFKFTTLPKIIVLGEFDTKKRILDKLQSGEISGAVALVGIDNENTTGVDLPYFNRDNTKEIKTFILEFFRQKIKDIPIYGLILAGGKSSRMGEDKGSLDYHGSSQVDHVQKILRNFTKHSFVSCRKEQSHLPHLKYHLQIHDRLIDMGPGGGIVSALMEHEKVAWLVIACDLPYLEEKTIEHLIEKRDPFKVATCYRSNENQLPEPLCAIYEPQARQKFFQFFAGGYSCPRKMLINSNVLNIDLLNENALANANTPSDFKKAKERLNLGEVLR